MSSEWSTYKLSNLATFKYGKFLAKSALATTGFPVFSGYGVVGYLPDYQFAERQLVIVCRGEGGTGDVKMSPPHCSVTNLSIVVSPDIEKVSRKFLYWALKASDTHALRTGSAQAQIVIGSLENFSLKIPSDRSYQDSVASLLDGLEDRITLLRETNATLEAIAQALFKSWFVDFEPARAKMEGRTPEGMDEATAALFPDGFETSELGEVPRGWRSATMEDVSIVGIGKTPPRKEQHWFSEDSNDVRWVSIRDMGICGTYASTTNEFLTAEAVDKFNVRRVPDNTVLMSFKMTIGRVAITDGEMTTNEAIAHFRLDPASQLSTEFIYLHLRQFDFSRLSSTSSIADAVNSKTVRQIPILVPSREVATAFQEKIGVVFEMLKSNEQQAQTLATLRDALLPRLISGQLRLPEAQALIEESM
ncbi:restriction modification system DNA specificity subunit [Acidovorax sp. NO-1]|uniref:restriction endonuclease subunit S n=1 Tax=Acidovorax sp. NO-1 TaxID=512030 RepID=UPI00023FCA1C|nr:restriction endonuclease subunit S [Acidovorax sp. NO-1]EHL24679.1 restriction modification system DNA specificity subunit [Acidovorax sp. NO-1]